MKANEIIERYKNSIYTSLYRCYAKPSVEKCKAFDAIREEMLRNGGRDLKIIGYNCRFFSCAYILGDKLIYHTYKNRYVLPRV